MTPQDNKICNTLTNEGDYWSTWYEFDWEETIKAMIGHPLLFLEEALEVRIDLVEGQMELLVEQQDTQFLIRLSEGDIEDRNILIVKEGLTKYKVIEITEQHKQIAKILGKKGLRVPAKAKDKILEAIHNLSSLITVHSAIEAKGENIEEVAADSKIYIHLLPSAGG